MTIIKGSTIEQRRLWQAALADNPHPSDPWWRKTLRRLVRAFRRYVW